MIAWAVGTWGFIFSLVAVLVSAASATYSRRQANEAKEQAKHAKTVADIETARRADELDERERRHLQGLVADVRLSLDTESRTATVQNLGPATAHGVAVIEAGTSERLLLLPVANVRLRPGERTSTNLLTSLSTKWPISFRVTWTDGLGSHEDVSSFMP